MSGEGKTAVLLSVPAADCMHLQTVHVIYCTQYNHSHAWGMAP